MRAVIDTNGLYTTRAGLARYLRGLLSGLKDLASEGRLDFSEFAWPVENFEFRQPQRAARTFYRECVWAPFAGPRILRRRCPDVFHSTSMPVLRPPTGITHVVTIHDLAVLRHPERFRPWQRRFMLRGLDRALRADRWICISRFAADEVIAALSFPASRLTVVHNGCDFQPGIPVPEEPPSEPIPERFLLFVGSLEPGKNLALLREMYARALEARVDLPRLVIVGARWQGLAQEGPPPTDWHYLGHVPDAQLVWLFRRAVALLFPSKYEGFGLPVVEAMALECPVVCSPVASLPEVAGDAALLVPLRAADYLEAVKRILGEAGLRQQLVARGRTQAARFTWRRCAEETCAVYHEALGR